MNQTDNKNYTISYSLYAFILAILIWLIFRINGIINHNFTFSLYGLYEYYKAFPLNWIFDFVLLATSVFMGYLIGRYFEQIHNTLEQDLTYEREKNRKVFHFTEKLRQRSFAEEEILIRNDELSKSLINLRDEILLKEKEELFRKEQEGQRHWITEGLATFGAVLRETSNNLETLSYSVVSELAKYLQSQLVGIFVIDKTNADKPIIEQTGAFAYGRKKFADKKLEWGEGLVGACILEQKTVFLKNVTDSYVEITSGLGKANPRSVLIVPLIFNEEVFGALEIASLKVFMEFEIEFVEKVAESIASTISSLKINMRTSQLLKDSQGQQMIMTRQENEMRRSMNELRQTQIEAAKQSEQFISFTNSVNHTMIRAEYSIEGILLYANTKFLHKLGYSSNKEIEGQHISLFINEKDREWFDELWTRLKDGGEHFEGDMKHVSKYGTDLWTMATYVSVRDQNGRPEKVLFLGIDMTESKKQSLDYTGQIDALNKSTIKADFSPGGKITDYNEKFQEAMLYEPAELQDKTIFDFINPSEINEFSIIWKNVIAGVPFERRLKMVTRNGNEKWFHGTFSIVNDMYGDISKVIYIANDITNQLNVERKNKIQTEKLKEQEEKLQHSQDELTRKLREAREEMRIQFSEIETVKVLNEKTLEGMLDAVVTINQDDKVQFFNKAAEELWSINRKQIINKHVNDLLPEKYKELGENYMGMFFRYGDDTLLNTRTEVFIVDKFGEPVSVLLTLSEAQIGKRYSLTAFIQKIEVELF
jgi:PAS domain S-box-containing protein